MILKKPATVSEAVAPFKNVQGDLRLVIKAAIDKRQASQARVMAAEKQLADGRE